MISTLLCDLTSVVIRRIEMFHIASSHLLTNVV